MRILQHRIFAKWAKVEKVSKKSLENAVIELNQGLFDANLGGGLYKKRVARAGGGKRGGYRTFVVFKKDDMAVFVYGLGKNKRANISNKEKEVFKQLSKYYLSVDSRYIDLLVETGKLIEVKS